MRCRGNAFCARDCNWESLPSEAFFFSLKRPFCFLSLTCGMRPCSVDGPNKGAAFFLGYYITRARHDFR